MDGFSIGEVSFFLDPLGMHKGSDPHHLVEALGILPHWLAEGIMAGEGARDALESRYPFPCPEMTGGTVMPDGTYLYPDDPALYPIAVCHNGDYEETVYFYPYAMVAVQKWNADNAWVTRMD